MARGACGPGSGSGTATGPRIQISGPRGASVVPMTRPLLVVVAPAGRPLTPDAPPGRAAREPGVDPWNEAVTSW
ncbi:hypothetical protein JCM4814A_20110 [Streptomyces phaeofaciens JCM 4814]|uniref:Uncharacterized protein n=1 Tax=Streptomyces phaeofaciens TaxID=68254 RepID=A0A918HEV5_9ACTN|nr:hypothetical protein GCM10010226_37260 [Streptomyces phaeofaciens]